MEYTFSAPLPRTSRDWRAAFTALRGLLADANDTAQVFRIVRALNTDVVSRGYRRLLGTTQGGRIAFEHVELAERFSDDAWLAGFEAGTVGAAYRDFLAATGYSADGLAEVSRDGDGFRDAAHPYAWYGRRNRDVHDIWHVLTGYQADDPLGEMCLVAFSYAQSGGLGFALIAAGGAFKALRMGQARAVKAIWDGYRRGRAASWLPGEDYERLLAEPIDQARRRLGIAPARAYSF